jgi:hypothetical protein
MARVARRTWLRLSAILLGAFGPVFAAGGIPATAEALRWSLDLLGWPPDGNMT